jgi:hypothetical protein
MPEAAGSDQWAQALEGCDAFVGAGLADRFDWKLRRLLEHQLPLSAHPALTALAPGDWRARMLVKGRLFYPLAHWRSSGAVMHVPALASDHERGWWATWDDWLAASAHAACHWTILDRLDWLAPLHIAEATAQRVTDAAAFAVMLRAYFDAHINDPAPLPPGQVRLPVRPIQVAALRVIDAACQPAGATANDAAMGAADDGERPEWQVVELSRGLIVPNDWPARAWRFRQSGMVHRGS